MPATRMAALKHSLDARETSTMTPESAGSAAAAFPKPGGDKRRNDPANHGRRAAIGVAEEIMAEGMSARASRPANATRPRARPSGSSLGTNENRGPLAALGASHVAIAVRGRGARRTEGGNGNLVLPAAAAASILRAVETPQRATRGTRGPAIVSRSVSSAFAPLRLIGGIAIIHAGIDVARSPARAEVGVVSIRFPA